MKKYLPITIIVLSIAASLHGQAVQKHSWTDGDPLFTQIQTSMGVLVDSTIRLIPVSETHSPDSFQYILYGEAGIWPIQKFPISAAYDVDYIEENNKKFYLVTDGYGRRVFEINCTNPNNLIEAGFSFTGQSRPLINPVDASIYYENGNRKILITDNGGNRVLKVDRLGGDEEWYYGDGTSGRGYNQLSGPSDALTLPGTSLILICDQGNSRIIMVQQSNRAIVWSYGEVGQLNPVDIEYEPITNSILITDRNNHRIILVSIDSFSIIWQFGTGEPGNTDYMLDSPTDADFLTNGNILICDAGNERLLEVNSNGEIEWSFEHRRLKNLQEADRLPDNRTFIIADYPPLLTNVPIWLGYSDSIFVSPIQVLDKKVNFDTLYWQGLIPPNTQIKFQIRSADNPIDLNAARWYGPSNTEPYFLNSGTAVNPIHHKAHSYYQFRAFLETDDTLHTPILNDFQLRYHYYNSKQAGTVTSTIITDSAGMIITDWTYLNFNTIQQATRNIKVSLINPATNVILKDFYAEDIDSASYHFPLSIWNELKGLQSIQLRTTISTSNTATTPILSDWGLEWNRTQSSISQINFIDAEENLITHYRVSPEYPPKEKKVDQVFIRLDDLNLAAVQNAITLKIRVKSSADEMDVLLERNPEGVFLLKRGIPAVIFNLSIPGNSFLEVFDRDTLEISYTDPTTPTDQSVARALIVQNSTGDIQIVNSTGIPVDTLAIGDTLYVNVTNEPDRNITPAQDTIWVEVYNNESIDRELLPLVEVPDSNNQYYNGNFTSAYGLPLVLNPTGISNDVRIQTMQSNQIAVRYEDNVTLQDYITVLRTHNTPIDSVFIIPQKPLDFDVAPNPFYVSKHNRLRLRAASTIGDLQVNRVEIYNLAGQKLRTIEGDQLNFDLSPPFPQNMFSYCDIWWDLRNEDNDMISSGLYWIKMYGSVTTSNGGYLEQLEAFKKVIIFR